MAKSCNDISLVAQFVILLVDCWCCMLCAIRNFFISQFKYFAYKTAVWRSLCVWRNRYNMWHNGSRWFMINRSCLWSVLKYSACALPNILKYSPCALPNSLKYSPCALPNILTLRLLMSYIYIYMELLVKPEILMLYIYRPTFGNTESHLFVFDAQCFNTVHCRVVSCVTVVCKHFASYQG